MIAKYKKVVFASVMVGFSFIGNALADGKPPITEELVSLGESVYQLECSSCHGADGAGDGPGAHYLNPRPRNFQLAVYKLRSTPNGELPTEQDLFNSITNGINGTMMPSFQSLSEEKRWALVEVIRRFGGIEDEEGVPIEVMARPEVTTASVHDGKQVYDRLECANCHGSAGLGDGPSSLTLENDDKDRVWAPNLTSGVYKGGSDPVELYKRIANGLDGSPMPSYAAEASPEEIWSLISYLETLIVPK